MTMSLLELFNQSMHRFEYQKEPITFALATVIQKKIDGGLNEEFEEFHKWFRENFYDVKGNPLFYFRMPMVDESPLIYGEKPRVLLLNGPYIGGGC